MGEDRVTRAGARWLVTGAAGQLGRSLAAQLPARGIEVIGLGSRELAVPGDQLTYEAEIENLAPEAASIRGTVRKNGELFGQVNMMFSHADNAMQDIELPENFVFTGSFQRMVEPFLQNDTQQTNELETSNE